MNINLSKFKKIECDDRCTTLEHPDGHEFRVAHSSLSKELRKDLEEMPMHLAKGGFAKHAQRNDPNMQRKASKPSEPSKPADKSAYTPPKMAKNAYTEPDNQGPDVVLAALDKKAPPFGPMGSPKYNSPPCINPSCKSYGRAHPNCRCYGGKMGMYGGYAEGGEVEDYCSKDNPHKEGCEYFAEGGGVEKDMENEDLQAELQAEMPQEVPQEEATVEAQAPTLSPEEEVAQEDQTLAPEIPERSPAASVNEPQAVAPEQELQPAMPQQPETPFQKFQKSKDENAQMLFPEAQAFQADLDNGSIQPQTYKDLFGKKDTLGKIGTLFGLLVGGAGAGLSGQPNALLDMMNKEIERDLDAQKTSQLNKQNYLKINQQNIMNRAQAGKTQAESDTISYALARSQMNLAALHDLVTQANKLPPGAQKDQMMQTLALMNKDIQNENFNILDRAAAASAFRNALFGGQGGGKNTMMLKSGLLGDEAKAIGQDTEDKTIFGIPGEAKLPIPQRTRDEVQAMKILSDKAEDLMQYAKENWATLDPRKRAVAKQKADEMINYYNASIQGGVLTEGRLKWLDDQIKKNPTGIVTQLMGNNARLKEIKDSNDNRMNIILDQYGFPKQKGASKKPSAPKEETRVMNGVTYKKVNGGWQKAK